MSPEPSSSHGTSNPAVVANILEVIEKEKEEEVKKRKLQDESHGAGEPAWKLKLDAHLARKSAARRRAPGEEARQR